MESSQLERIQVWEQPGARGEETQRSRPVREEGKHTQVEREGRSVQLQQDIEMRLLPKKAPATLQVRKAQAEGVGRQQERSRGLQELNGSPLNGKAKQSGKSVHYLEVRLKLRDYRHTCKKQLFNFIACFFRFISGNLSSDGKEHSL